MMNPTTCLVLLASSFALATAGWIPYIGGGHHKEEHHPIIHDGVPLDTPEVQHARAEHLAAVAEAKAHAGYQSEEHHHYGGGDEHSFGDDLGGGLSYGHGGGGDESEHEFSYAIQHIAQPQHHESFEHLSSFGGHYEHSAPAFETSHHEPIVDHDGKPLDTPEVEKAKALHFAEVHKALARLHEHGHGGHHHGLHKRDLSEYSTHVEHGGFHSGYDAPVYEEHIEHASYGHGEVPQIGHDGKPLDTAEVEHAKALHFAAHQEALARVAHAKSYEPVELSYHY